MKRGMSLLVESVGCRLVGGNIPVSRREAEEWQEGNIPKLQIERQNLLLLGEDVVETSTRNRVGVYPHIAGSTNITVLLLTDKVRRIADGRTRAKVTPHPRFGILRERSLLLVVIHPNSVNSGTIQTPLAALNISSSNNNNGIIPAPLTVDSINNNNHVKRSRGPRQFSIKNQKGKCFSRHHISGVSVCVLCNDYHAK